MLPSLSRCRIRCTTHQIKFSIVNNAQAKLNLLPHPPLKESVPLRLFACVARQDAARFAGTRGFAFFGLVASPSSKFSDQRNHTCTEYVMHSCTLGHPVNTEF